MTDRRAAPGSEPTGNRTKVTRAEWLQAALDTLRSDGIDHVRIQTIAQRLDVARSSFYWYFQSRENLLDELLGCWSSTNTASIVARAARPADTITAAVIGIFEVWSDPSLFDPQLDFAVRDWAKRDASVAGSVAAADAARLGAIEAMYERHGFDDPVVWACVLYLMQVGYYALGIVEPAAARLAYTPAYLRAMTGREASPAELDRFAEHLRLEPSQPDLNNLNPTERAPS